MGFTYHLTNKKDNQATQVSFLEYISTVTKKVLITGSNGLLGQKLLDKLRNNSTYTVIATAKGVDRYLEEGYSYESLDVTNHAEVIAIMQKHKPDHVIHTAAMTNVDACESDKELCKKLNVDAVQYFIEACKQTGAHFIHLSTDFIFDGADGPYDENAVANPLSYYGQTKLESELLLINSDIAYAILRTIIVYGVVKDMSRSNIILWAKGALEKGQKINVVNDQYRNPTLAEDLADICVLAMEKRAQGIYNASGKDFMSILEIVERVADFWNLDKSLITPISAETLNQSAKRPVKTEFILDKSVKELGYNPHSFEEGLKIVNNQLNHN
ncbi:SDR family oxidoreductase [Solitalea canadensis]|uniref:dTDP-4-dehydrorhamnose reductase n=1 Tax=Solitalea canadensis (strain ATCC 29591 / DSM 3403 / JCM 21819 / LMG 8368 / NBRC 15130 / NCIMB 12057 / USAM 9D) TaxID=929556 RepID=H8KS26_SOLCM|nr:SDR family oxidoreductase [Solitalea canadensis]AFD07814.1 dTDP-4-dehydrorhamnose reductase [Solitalea canadensis DSM 3403]